jgi:hypothetical protein
MTNTQFTYESTKAYDLNIFYAEDWNEDQGTIYDDCLSIQVYLYVADGDGSRTYEGELIKLTLAETRALAPDFPIEEYGTDFWTGVDAFLEEAKACPESITKWLNSLIPAKDVHPYMEPMVWYTKNS